MPQTKANAKARSKRRSELKKELPPSEVFFQDLTAVLDGSELTKVLGELVPLGKGQAAAIIGLLGQRLMALLGSDDPKSELGLKGELRRLARELEELKEAGTRKDALPGPVSTDRMVRFARATVRILEQEAAPVPPPTKARTTSEVASEIKAVEKRIAQVERAINDLDDLLARLQGEPGSQPAPGDTTNVLEAIRDFCLAGGLEVAGKDEDQMIDLVRDLNFFLDLVTKTIWAGARANAKPKAVRDQAKEAVGIFNAAIRTWRIRKFVVSRLIGHEYDDQNQDEAARADLLSVKVAREIGYRIPATATRIHTDDLLDVLDLWIKKNTAQIQSGDGLEDLLESLKEE